MTAVRCSVLLPGGNFSAIFDKMRFAGVDIIDGMTIIGSSEGQMINTNPGRTEMTRVTTEHLKTFRRVYHEARAIYLDIDGAAEHAPMDAVVRFEDRGENAFLHGGSSADGLCWLLDSGLHSNEDTILKCDLDAFDSWFYEGYQDAEYEPTADDMRDFAETLEG